jgi:hypothetical protein
MEIIVVDNGSEDSSQQAVRTEFPEAKLIDNGANLGFARANNIGIRVSTGRYICLLNSDVRNLDGCITSLCDYMNGHPNVGIVGPKILWPDMTGQDSCRKFPSLWNSFCSATKLTNVFPRSEFFSGEHMSYFRHDRQRKVDYLAGCFLMIRREALDEVGLFDESFFIYAEEMDLCKRFWQSGWEVIFFPDAKAIHHHGASSSREPVRFAAEQIKSKIKYWKKHYSRSAVTSFLIILVMHHALRLGAGGILYVLALSERSKIGRQLSDNYACLKYVLTGKYVDKGCQVHGI